MKGYPRLIKLFVVGLVCVLVPVLVFAADGDTNPLWQAFHKISLAPPKDDISVAFLMKIFGFVPGIPQFVGVGSTIMGVLFGVFNNGVLALSGVFLAYTITKLLTETTMDGSAMGKSTTVWTAVRCALSTSLLVPQASGYSMVNSLVMWVVIQSVGLADMTWNQAMDYLKSGGGTYAPPNAKFVDYSLIGYGINTGDDVLNSKNTEDKVGANDVLRSLTCAYTIRAAMQHRQAITRAYIETKRKEGGVFRPTLYMQEYLNASKTIPTLDENTFSLFKETEYKCKKDQTEPNCTYEYSDGIFQFPYIKDEANSKYDKNYGLVRPDVASDFVPRDLTGKCGTINYTVPKGDLSDADYAATASRYTKLKRQGLIDMIAALKPVAEDLVKKIGNMDSKGKRDLDPDTYEVYKENGVSVGFLLNPTPLAPNLPNLNDNSPENLTSSKLLKSYKEGLPAINWPIASDELLTAAAAYQEALAPAQEKAQTEVGDDLKKQYEDAKKQGWIAAGNFHRLLIKKQDRVQREYDYYRLTAYKDAIHQFSIDEAKSLRDGVYDAMFYKQIHSLNPPDNRSSLDQIWTNDSGDTDLLDKTLSWVNYTYPFAQLRGLTLAPSLEETATGITVPSDFARNISYDDRHSTVVKVHLGCTILAIPPLAPVAIASLPEAANRFLKYRVGQVVNRWKDVMGPANADTDPVLKLQNLGTEMLKQGVGYIGDIQFLFQQMAVAVTISSAIQLAMTWIVAGGSFWGATTGVQQAMNSTSEFGQHVMDVVQTIVIYQLPFALAVIGPMLVSGATLAIYVPIIPYMLFLFGTITWFISVIVLMAAAPIICFLMLWANSSQENPLLSREAEQFVMQIVGVFFRPVLMIIGLVTGIVLSYIGVDLLNLGFDKLQEFLNLSDDDSAVKMAQTAGIIVVYTFTMMSIVNMCFSTIHSLYSEVMRIASISAPAVGMEEKGLEMVKGGVSQYAESAAGGIKETGTTLKGVGAKARYLQKRQSRAEQQSQDKNKANPTITPGPG